MHAFRRLAAAVVLTLPLLSLGPAPAAHADQCSEDVSPIGPVDPPPVYFPCPSENDQPVGAPLWITTEYGPGWESPEWDFVEVYEGSHVFVTNVQYRTDIRFYGTGFDSGLIPKGSAREVLGVPSLAPGTYIIHNETGFVSGRLVIDPLPRPCCV
jgi:hypothetical protein